MPAGSSPMVFNLQPSMRAPDLYVSAPKTVPGLSEPTSKQKSGKPVRPLSRQEGFLGHVFLWAAGRSLPALG